MGLYLGIGVSSVAATKDGKSMCFQAGIPLYPKKIATVVQPTNLLMQGQFEDLSAYNILTCYLTEDTIEEQGCNSLINKIINVEYSLCKYSVKRIARPYVFIHISASV